VAFDSPRHTSRPGRRALLLGGVPLAVVLALVLAAYVNDHGRSDVIAPGVRVAGVKVGGLRAPAARARLRDELRRIQEDWITVRHRALGFSLTGAQAHLSADVDGAVRDAVRASRLTTARGSPRVGAVQARRSTWRRFAASSRVRCVRRLLRTC
jgi:hypothetical protein